MKDNVKIGLYIVVALILFGVCMESNIAIQKHVIIEAVSEAIRRNAEVLKPQCACNHEAQQPTAPLLSTPRKCICGGSCAAFIDLPCKRPGCSCGGNP